jgi:hypothetical protein
VRHSTQAPGGSLTNIGWKGDFMYSWVQVDHIRWKALVMQVSREPLQKYRTREIVQGIAKAPKRTYSFIDYTWTLWRYLLLLEIPPNRSRLSIQLSVQMLLCFSTQLTKPSLFFTSLLPFYAHWAFFTRSPSLNTTPRTWGSCQFHFPFSQRLEHSRRARNILSTPL